RRLHRGHVGAGAAGPDRGPQRLAHAGRRGLRRRRLSGQPAARRARGGGAPGEIETAELHAPGIQVAATAPAVVRVVVGFTTALAGWRLVVCFTSFLLAFHFTDLEAAVPWASKIGLVGCIVMAQVGFLVGSAAAIRVRRSIGEEQIIVAALAVVGGTGVLTAL